jgi:hypothetical protein
MIKTGKFNKVLLEYLESKEEDKEGGGGEDNKLNFVKEIELTNTGVTNKVAYRTEYNNKLASIGIMVKDIENDKDEVLGHITLNRIELEKLLSLLKKDDLYLR